MIDKTLHIAKVAAVEAGWHAKEMLGKTQQKIKTEDQIVTNADIECQNIIIKHIRDNYPEHGIIAEEGSGGKMLHQPPRGSDDTWWIIDPIDGTRNYAHQVPLYCCSIGVIQNGSPYLGVIYDPNLDLLFIGGGGQPATLNGKPIKACNETLHRNSQIAFSGNIHKRLPNSIDKFMEDFVYVNLGSAALHYAFAAMGAFSAAISWNVKLWDIAAGAAIIQAAGGNVWNTNGQPRFPLDCRSYDGRPVPVLFAGEKVKEQIIELIKKDLKEQ